MEGRADEVEKVLDDARRRDRRREAMVRRRAGSVDVGGLAARGRRKAFFLRLLPRVSRSLSGGDSLSKMELKRAGALANSMLLLIARRIVKPISSLDLTDTLCSSSQHPRLEEKVRSPTRPSLGRRRNAMGTDELEGTVTEQRDGGGAELEFGGSVGEDDKEGDVHVCACPMRRRSCEADRTSERLARGGFGISTREAGRLLVEDRMVYTDDG